MKAPVRQAAITIAASITSGAVAFSAGGDGLAAMACVVCVTFVMAFLSYYAAGGES